MAPFLVAIAAFPVGAQTTPQPLTPGSHTLAIPLGDAREDQAAWSMELRARNSEDRIDIPAVVRFVPPEDVELFRATAFQIRTVASSRRDHDRWFIQLPRAVNFSLSRSLVQQPSFTVTLNPYAIVAPGGNASRGTNVSTWLSKGAHQLSVTAGVAQDVEQAVSTTLYAYFSRTVAGSLRGTADVTYAGGPGEDWTSTSQSITYQLTPALELALASRQEAADAGLQRSVNVQVNVRLDR